MLITQEQLPALKLSSMHKAHEKEIELISKLHAVAKKSEAKAVLEQLSKLLEHTRGYFAEEERLMQKAQYPDYPIHKHEHAKQLMDLQSILSFYEMTNDTQSIAAYLEDTLTPWITEHVHNMDSAASEFLKQ